MSSFNPGAKAGYTKSGKSLKAVRRYYALLNQQQQKSRSPEEDKLSKRIALELKTQQDANEKRSKRDGQPLLEAPTERSELPGVLVSAKETGPVFLGPPASVPATKSTAQDAIKSVVKSVKTVRVEPESQTNDGLLTKFIYFLVGLIVGLILGAVIYWAFAKYVISKKPVPRGLNIEGVYLD